MKTSTLGVLLLLLFGKPQTAAAQSETFRPSKYTTGYGNNAKNDKDKDGDPDNNNGWGNNKPQNVPFDGGLAVLLAAGAAYGVKKYRDQKQLAAEA